MNGERRILADAALVHTRHRVGMDDFERRFGKLERAAPADESRQQCGVDQQHDGERNRSATGETLPVVTNPFCLLIVGVERADLGLGVLEFRFALGRGFDALTRTCSFARRLRLFQRGKRA